jgi:tricorn protease
MKKVNLLVAVIALLGVTPGPHDLHAQGPPVTDAGTIMLSQPATSAAHIAFTYAGDLWVARHDGSDVRRLTTHPGVETNPRFSPDGRTLAFSGEYDGNTDVFVVPVQGGVPERLTWHPGADIVQGFTVDGQGVLFTSSRSTYTGRHRQLFTVSLAGGHPDQLPIPHAFKATYSPDGSHIAYTPLYEPFNQWKNYRGGTATRIWLFDTADYSVQEIPQPEGRSNDTDPMWIGDQVYFRSDRNGEFNLFSFDPGSEEIRQLTSHEDFPVLAASAGGDRIAYEQAGRIHLLDPGSGQQRPVPIAIATDLVEVRPRFAEGTRFIRDATVSPSAARAAFEFRGEIVTVPREKGDHRNLTRTPGAHERFPAWSPDGSSIAYFSDESGEYALHVAPQDGKGGAKAYALDGAGFYDNPRWSPDGTMISYTDNARAIFWIDLESGQTTRVDADMMYSPVSTPRHSWSPDSRWLLYSRNNATNLRTLYVHSIESGESRPISDGLSEVADAVFDASGKYIYMAVSTDAGPVIQWFAQSNADFDMTNSIYLVVLESGTPSPLARESDEEEGAESDAAGEEGAGNGNGDQAGSEGDDTEVRIDFEGLDQRILALPLRPAGYRSLQAGKPGQLFYLRSDTDGGFGGPGGETSLRRFDLDEREETILLTGTRGFELSGDGKSVLYATSQGAWFIASATGGEIRGDEGKIAAGDIQVRIEPRAEWAQIYQEAWRINRDFFYDPGMHGADWDALKEKYAVFLPHLVTRADLNRLLQWLHSELGVGHHRGGGGDFLLDADNVPGGLLGADFDVDQGRYRFAKVYGGLNWNPGLRSPLTEPGVEVQTGEYLLAVEGRDLRSPENLFSRFENTSGKIVEITVGPNADGTGSPVIGWRATSARSTRLRTDGWPTCMSRTPQVPGTRTSSAISSRSRTGKRSSSMSATTGAVRSRTTTSTSSAARSPHTGPRGTERTWRLPRGPSSGPRSC